MRLLSLGLLAATLPLGCIVYDTNDPGCAHGDCAPEGDGGAIPPGDGDHDVPAALELALTPPEAEQGETFIAYLSAIAGEADFREVADLVFYGDVAVLARDAFANQVILSLAVPDDAETGEVDLVVEWADGDASWVPAALTIWEAGSGHAAADWDGEDSVPGEGGGAGGSGSGDPGAGGGTGGGGTETGDCP